jgi:hypothetical protein
MHRLVLAFLADGIWPGSAIALFIWIGGYRFSWRVVAGLTACTVVAAFLRLIPEIRAEIMLQRILSKTGSDEQNVLAEPGLKKRPLISGGMIALVGMACLLGLVARLLR